MKSKLKYDHLATYDKGGAHELPTVRLGGEHREGEALTKESGSCCDDSRSGVDGADVQSVTSDRRQPLQQYQTLLPTHLGMRHLHHSPPVCPRVMIKTSTVRDMWLYGSKSCKGLKISHGYILVRKDEIWICTAYISFPRIKSNAKMLSQSLI